MLSEIITYKFQQKHNLKQTLWMIFHDFWCTESEFFLCFSVESFMLQNLCLIWQREIEIFWCEQLEHLTLINHEILYSFFFCFLLADFMIVIKACYLEALEVKQKICLSACSDEWNDEWDLLSVIVAIFNSWAVMLWRKRKIMKEKKKEKKERKIIWRKFIQ